MKLLANRRLQIGVAAMLCLSLLACNSTGDAPAPALDRVADALPFPKPVLDAAPRLAGEAGLPASSRQTLALQRAFFAGDFDTLEAAIAQSRDAFLAGQGDNGPLNRLLASLKGTQLAGIDACADWLRARPDSYAAHLACASMWNSGAWAVRGNGFADSVSEAQFSLMHERLARGNALLERAITLTPKPVEALALLGDMLYSTGDRSRAEEHLARADALKPGVPQIYWTRLNFAREEWGGSDAQVQAVLKQAKAAGLDEAVLLNMHDLYVARPWKTSVPGAARAYWERAIQEHPTHRRLVHLRDDFIRMGNWREALPVASRLIADYPGHADDFYWRARIHEGAGQVAEARADYETAALMGHELSLQGVMLAHLRGGLGLTEKSFDAAVSLCRYGAALGLGVGANCIGSLYDEGGREGVPHRNDIAQSLAWHLVGARGGHYNSQHDLGWLLYTGRGGVADAKQSQALGVFWLRRAAEQNHVFAKRKLEEAGIPEQEPQPMRWRDVLDADSVVAAAYALIRIVF